MQFDVLRFLRTAQRPYHAAYSPELSDRDFPGYETDGPVDAVLDADITGDKVHILLHINVGVKGECARCLDPVCERYEFETEYLLKEDEILTTEPELPINEKGVLDADELIYQEIVMYVPQVMLCSPDCPGLCPVCGKKKAAGHTCQAADEPAPADPRLSILKQLLN